MRCFLLTVEGNDVEGYSWEGEGNQRMGHNQAHDQGIVVTGGIDKRDIVFYRYEMLSG